MTNYFKIVFQKKCLRFCNIELLDVLKESYLINRKVRRFSCSKNLTKFFGDDKIDDSFKEFQVSCSVNIVSKESVEGHGQCFCTRLF